MLLMKNFLQKVPRYLFFTGKGGVGKTSMACTTAIGLSDNGKRVLLISTDPASNLDEVLGTPLSSKPVPISAVSGLSALNINPMQAAAEYREHMVEPYRNILPPAAVKQMEEQLSGACTVEIAGFNEFSRLLADDETLDRYDHIVLDTAPTGHTLRLLNLPSAWNDFIASNQTGSSCLGPVSGLKEQKIMFEQVIKALKDPKRTLLVLVSRAEKMSFSEAERTSRELRETGLQNQHLIINGVFRASSDDLMAVAFARKMESSQRNMPAELKTLPFTEIPFYPAGLVGIETLRLLYISESENDSRLKSPPDTMEMQKITDRISEWPELLSELSEKGKGLIMTMGKGGVGKTTMAAAIAAELIRMGHKVILSTTDPAAHITQTIGSELPDLTIERIDPKVETERYVKTVLEKNAGLLSPNDMALLEEEMRSPCIEEIAVFQAFAQTVAKGEELFVVLDTAPTGHTLLLLDATMSYHREVAKSVSKLPDAVKSLLPRIRDPEFTRILLVTLPEATPVHEASALQNDLRRAGINPYAWIVNRCFAFCKTKDPDLLAKGACELGYLHEVTRLTEKLAASPWIAEEPNNPEALKKLFTNPNMEHQTPDGLSPLLL
jgi:arsenite-transporting ATPase